MFYLNVQGEAMVLAAGRVEKKNWGCHWGKAKKIMNKISIGYRALYNSLFVFSINGPKQNARSLLTQISSSILHALSHDSLHFGLHGS